MANIKFSQFTVETAKADVDFLVGYSGPDNVQISPTNLLADYPAGSGAAGQVTFFNAASTVTGDNDFYWDNTNKRLGIGTATPGNKLEVQVTSNGHGVLFKSNATQIGSILRTAIGGTVSMTVDGAGTRPININNSSSSDVLIANGGGNVGIGTTSPSAKLEVDGTLIATGISQLGSGGSNVLLTSSSAGNVGIGTSSPSEKLEVNGSVEADSYKISNTTVLSGSADVYVGSGGGTGRVFLNNTSGIGLALSGANVGIGTTSPSEKLEVDGRVKVQTSAGSLTIKEAGSSSAAISGSATISVEAISNFRVKTGSSLVENFTVLSTGNVGIGTTSPTQKLEIEGNVYVGGSVRIKDNGDQLEFGNANVALQRTSNLLELGGYDGIVFKSSNTVLDSQLERMRITSTGNVGIGIDSPQTKLHIVGPNADGSEATLRVGGPSDGTGNNVSRLELVENTTNSNADMNYGFSFTTDGNSSNNLLIKNHSNNIAGNTAISVNRNDGSVGIGTTSPANTLDVNGDVYINSNYPSNTAASDLTIGKVTTGDHGLTIVTSNSNTAGIFFADSDNNDAGRIKYQHSNNSMRFETNRSEAMRIDSSGNVGIGTSSPASRLEVDGGDIEVDDSASGLILRSPDGTRYRVTVANGGTLSVSAV